MKMNTKTILGVAVVGALGYYLWKQGFFGKKTSSFVGNEDSEFYNLGGEEGTRRTTFTSAGAMSQNCVTYKGNANASKGTILSDGRIITETGRGFTTVCSQPKRFRNL